MENIIDLYICFLFKTILLWGSFRLKHLLEFRMKFSHPPTRLLFSYCEIKWVSLSGDTIFKVCVEPFTGAFHCTYCKTNNLTIALTK